MFYCIRKLRSAIYQPAIYQFYQSDFLKKHLRLNHYFCLKVTWGLVLQFIFALVILRWPLGQSIIKCIGEKIGQFLGFTNEGSSFIFGYLVTQKLFDENRLSNDSIAYKCSPCSFIQILSQLYHDFVSILCQFCLDFVPIYPDFISILSLIYPDIIQIV